MEMVSVVNWQPTDIVRQAYGSSYVICCGAVRSVILATAWLLVRYTDL